MRSWASLCIGPDRTDEVSFRTFRTSEPNGTWLKAPPPPIPSREGRGSSCSPGDGNVRCCRSFPKLGLARTDAAFFTGDLTSTDNLVTHIAAA